MRILMINQFFWPDVAPTGQLLCDLARHLCAEGHEVTVICSKGSYAEGEFNRQNPPPVRIIRVSVLPYTRGSLARLFSYVTFFAGALFHEFRVPRPDIIVTLTTPPLLAIAGAILKSIRGTRHFLWEMDLFPDALVTLGALSENSVVTRVLGWFQDVARRHSDGIVALGPCMRSRLLGRGVPAHLLHVAENWADGSTITPGPDRCAGPLNILYSGNFGLAHDVHTIAGAMRHFRNDPRFLFTFAGGGLGRNELAKVCSHEGIRNARFLPYANRDEMNEHLAQADIGLVTERPACIGTVVPSKMYGLMAAGRPILFIGPRDATPGVLISRFRCGWQVNAGDIPALIALLGRLFDRRHSTWVRGRRARAAFEKHYDLPHGVARVAAALGISGNRAQEPGRNRIPEPARTVSE